MLGLSLFVQGKLESGIGDMNFDLKTRLGLVQCALGVCSCIFFLESLTAQPVENVHIGIGESHTVDQLENADLQVSRKSVIDAYYVGKGRWRLTGLRNGFVILVWRDETSREVGRLHMTVGKLRSPFGGQFPAAFCNSRKKIRCDYQEKRISGELDDFRLWLYLKSMCLMKEGCLFSIRLSADALIKYRNWLNASLGDSYQVKITGSGLALVGADCLKRDHKAHVHQIERLTQGRVPTTEFVVLCKESLGEFIVSAKIVAVDRSALSELGLRFEDDPGLLNSAKADLLSVKLTSLVRNRRARTISEPWLRVGLGREATLHSGGEMLVRNQQAPTGDVATSTWKRLGLELKVKVLRAKGNEITMSYSVAIGHKQSFRQLRKNSVSAEIGLQAGERVLVGSAEMRSLVTAGESDFSFQNIPILGPLFRVRSKQSQHMKLFVWLKVERV